MKHVLYAVLVVSLGVATPVLAQTGASSSGSSPLTYGDLSALQTQNEILSIEAENSKLQKEIADNGKSASSTPVQGVPGQSLSSSAVQSALPMVSVIEGSGSDFWATVQLPSGGEITATRGSPLPGGLTVYSISADGVQVMDAGNVVMLPAIGASQPSSAGQGGASLLRNVPVFPVRQAN